MEEVTRVFSPHRPFQRSVVFVNKVKSLTVLHLGKLQPYSQKRMSEIDFLPILRMNGKSCSFLLMNDITHSLLPFLNDS